MSTMLQETMLSLEERVLGELIVATDKLAHCVLREHTPEMRREAGLLHALVGRLLAELAE
jgi:hypothetical protein